MTSYRLSWITETLAMGHAPMSYAELGSLREQGIGAIINLCAEFCDLHEIEESQGFEVYYLPVVDDAAPSEPELERALDWLDEAVYLGKKVLVHCRYGMGRTATFVAAYLLRKGFGLKLAKKKVQEARTMHSSFSQWRLLRKYSKKSGKLTIREPSLEVRRIVDLSPFFHDYEALLRWVDDCFGEASASRPGLESCGLQTDRCCYEYVRISFVEATYLGHHMNRVLPLAARRSAIERAVQVAKKVREIRSGLNAGTDETVADRPRFSDLYRASKILCPLSVDGKCEMYDFRPVACRIFGLGEEWSGRPTGAAFEAPGGWAMDLSTPGDRLRISLSSISSNMLYALSSLFFEGEGLAFLLADAVSGKFIQTFFDVLNSPRADDRV